MDFTNLGNVEPQTGRFSVRASLTSRVSRIFGKRHEGPPMDQSHRTSAACSVPIFLSPSSDRIDAYHCEDQSPHRHVQGEGSLLHHHQRFTIPASSVYSESPGQQHPAHFVEQIEELPSELSGLTRDLEAGTSGSSYATSETPIARDKRRKRKRVSESRRERIASKKRLSMAFGVTVLATTIICESHVKINLI